MAVAMSLISKLDVLLASTRSAPQCRSSAANTSRLTVRSSVTVSVTQSAAAAAAMSVAVSIQPMAALDAPSLSSPFL
jgi:hypothetical protein